LAQGSDGVSDGPLAAGARWPRRAATAATAVDREGSAAACRRRLPCAATAEGRMHGPAGDISGAAAAASGSGQLSYRRALSPDASAGAMHGGGTPAAQQEGQDVPFGGGVHRKKLYDKNLSDWSARYRKNKQSLEALAKDCDQLRNEVGKLQQEVDDRAEGYKQLEDRFDNQIAVKFQDTKTAYEVAKQQSSMLQAQMSENRKQKTQLLREKKILTADYERKHTELMSTCEVHDRLEGQLMQLTHQLDQMTSERRCMERELDEVHHNLRANTELADEVTNEISHFQDGIKYSVDLHMAPAVRPESSAG